MKEVELEEEPTSKHRGRAGKQLGGKPVRFGDLGHFAETT